MKKIYIYLSIFIVSFICLFANIKIAASAAVNLDTEEVIYKWDYENENLIFFYFPELHATYYRNFLTLLNLDTGGEDPIFKRINDTLLNSSDIQIAPGYPLQGYFWAFVCKHDAGIFDFEIFVCNVSDPGTADALDFSLVHSESKAAEDLDNVPNAIKFDAESVLWIRTTQDSFISPGVLQSILFNNILSDANAFGRWVQTIKDDYEDRGYEVGYNRGYNDALEAGGFLVGVFNAIDAFLSIRILPGITIGIFVAVPLVLGLIELIGKFWLK